MDAGSVARDERSQGGIISVSGSRARKTSDADADGEVVWSRHPLLVSSSRGTFGPTGPDEPLIRERPWQKEFVTGSGMRTKADVRRQI